MSEVAVPEGYRENALGELIPVSRIKAVDLLRDELVNNIVQKAKALQPQLVEFKANSMSEIADFIDLSAEEFDVKYGGTKGNVTLTSFCGQYRVIRAKAELRAFDERMQAGKAKLDEILLQRQQSSDDLIKAIINKTFKVNKQGLIDVNQVLGLRALAEDDPEWVKAINAMVDSAQVVGTRPYLRIYERQEDGAYKQIALDIAKL